MSLAGERSRSAPVEPDRLDPFSSPREVDRVFGHDEAIAEYQFAVNFDANDKRAFYELANLYRAHGAYDDAIKLYRKQLEIEPKHSPSYKGLALAYLAQGNEEQTAAALNQARDLRGSAD